MRAGKLRYVISIQTPVKSQDTHGQEVTTGWTNYATVRASHEPLVGREFFAAKQAQSEVTARFRCRYLAGVTPEMRVVFSGRTFDIKSAVSPQGVNRELVIMAVENTG